MADAVLPIFNLLFLSCILRVLLGRRNSCVLVAHVCMLHVDYSRK